MDLLAVARAVRRQRGGVCRRRRSRAPCAARRRLVPRSGLRALGRPLQERPGRPERRHRFSCVVFVPHPRPLITEAPPPGGANGAKRRFTRDFLSKISATRRRCKPRSLCCSGAWAGQGTADSAYSRRWPFGRWGRPSFCPACCAAGPCLRIGNNNQDNARSAIRSRNNPNNHAGFRVLCSCWNRATKTVSRSSSRA